MERAPLQVDIAENPPDEPVNCIAKSKSHKSCRCVRCLSRYGHLGARTRESYVSPINGSRSNRNRNEAMLHTPFSKSNLRSSLDTTFNSIMSEDQSRTFVEAESFPVESFSQMEPTNYRSSIDPSIVVIESTCTVTDHLKYRIQSISQLTKDYEKKKTEIQRAKGKKIIITPKKKICY